MNSSIMIFSTSMCQQTMHFHVGSFNKVGIVTGIAIRYFVVRHNGWRFGAYSIQWIIVRLASAFLRTMVGIRVGMTSARGSRVH